MHDVNIRYINGTEPVALRQAQHKSYSADGCHTFIFTVDAYGKDMQSIQGYEKGFIVINVDRRSISYNPDTDRIGLQSFRSSDKVSIATGMMADMSELYLRVCNDHDRLEHQLPTSVIKALQKAVYKVNPNIQYLDDYKHINVKDIRMNKPTQPVKDRIALVQDVANVSQFVKELMSAVNNKSQVYVFTGNLNYTDSREKTTGFLSIEIYDGFINLLDYTNDDRITVGPYLREHYINNLNVDHLTITRYNRRIGETQCRSVKVDKLSLDVNRPYNFECTGLVLLVDNGNVLYGHDMLEQDKLSDSVPPNQVITHNGVGLYEFMTSVDEYVKDWCTVNDKDYDQVSKPTLDDWAKLISSVLSNSPGHKAELQMAFYWNDPNNILFDLHEKYGENSITDKIVRHFRFGSYILDDAAVDELCELIPILFVKGS